MEKQAMKRDEDLSDIPSREDWERAQEAKRQALDALFLTLPSWEDWSRAQVPIEEDAEKAKRRFAVQSANGTQRAAGFHVDDFLHQLQERFIAGELSTEEAIDEIKKHHGLKG